MALRHCDFLNSKRQGEPLPAFFWKKILLDIYYFSSEFIHKKNNGDDACGPYDLKPTRPQTFKIKINFDQKQNFYKKFKVQDY